MPGRFSRALAIALTLAVLAGACSRSSQARTDSGRVTSPPSTESVAPRTGPLEWDRCDVGRDTECAFLAVPIDWTDPDGATIDLAIARVPAPGNAIGSLVMNPGGPGGSGLELLANGRVPAPIAQKYDLVSWDPRGVGRSAGLDCSGPVEHFLSQDPEPDDESERLALESAAEAVSSECAASGGDLLANMRTEDTARDLEAIRAALGDERLNYLGYSYGTHIGQVYASLYPERVGTMVLDGVVDPEESFTEFLLSQTRAFEAALERQAVECTKAGKVTCGVEDLWAAYDEVHQMVERRRIEGTTGSVGPAELSIAAITSAYQPRGWHVLGPALREALKGNGTMIRRIFDSYQSMGAYTSYAAVVCTDGPTPRGTTEYRRFAEEAAAVSARFGAAIANELLPCATWPVTTDEERTTVMGDIAPIVLIGNTGDPATPFANAEAVHDRIDGSVLIAVDGDGHTALGTNPCVDRLVGAYLVEGRLPDTDLVRC